MLHITEVLSDFLAKLDFDQLPSEVIRLTKYYIIDYYAACCAGYRINQKFNHAIIELIQEMGGKEESDYVLSHKKMPSANAAFLSACLAHGADMDDGNRKAMGHVGAHVISAVMSLAQVLGSSGKQVIVAINAGYEVYNRVAAGAQPGLVWRGFHSTGTVGAIACSAACAKLMNLDARGIYNAMSLGAIQASGLIIIAESGQSCKPLNPANAARTGIISAQLAQRGIESSVYPLESQKGFFHAMSDKIDENIIIEGLGEQFTICESYMKPYPSCRHTHCGIECALEIRKKINSIDDIKKINVYIYGNAIRIAGQIKVPKTADDTKFSIHYSLAVALMHGRFTLSDLNIEEIEKYIPLIDKIELIEDALMENSKEGIRGCRVSVETEDGTVYEKEVLIPLGDADNPFSLEDLREKLYACAEGILSEPEQQCLMQNILELETIPKIQTMNLYE